MNTIRVFLFCATALAVCLSGCSRTKRPDGLPKRYPCTITVTEGGVPAAGIRVSLYAPPLTERWAVAGDTNAAGTAHLQTHGAHPGVPEGVYKVVLSKSVMEGGSGGEEGRKPEPIKVYSLIDPKYADAETTPLEIAVGPRTGSASFEIGKPVRLLVEVMTDGQ